MTLVESAFRSSRDLDEMAKVPVLDINVLR